ncbi:class E sortase [Glycomyces sp. A-F 0318]|uniref:class E sortase n=1 Tax=Glycomyces amatae TaxID=2881355 RepID=UPI001E37535C|nr:class E sortase [Glycomyces amatae]
MSDQDWSPFANEPRSGPPQGPGEGGPPPASPPRPPAAPGPGRAGVPGSSGQAKVPAPGPDAGGGPPAAPSPPGSLPPRPDSARSNSARSNSARPSPGPRTPAPPYSPPRQSSPPPAAATAPPPAEPDFDTTTALRPPSLARAERASLVPEPDGTAILPVIPADDTPAPPGADSAARKNRSVKRHRGEGGLRGTVRGLGEALITLGAVVLLYAGYEVFGVSGEINNEQETLSGDLDTIWSGEVADEGVDGAPVPELGDAFARMWAPDIRAESWTLVEGTEPADIEYAPGRYLDGAYPGDQGNFTLAGHNVPAIFQKIRDLEPGDKVVIETKENFYVYEVQEHEVVNETQVDITAPVPGEPGTEPGDEDYWLTLFTCHPLWDNYERYVVYSQLVDTVPRDPEGDLPDAAIDPEV